MASSQRETKSQRSCDANSGGVIYLLSPVLLDKEVVLVGDGAVRGVFCRVGLRRVRLVHESREPKWADSGFLCRLRSAYMCSWVEREVRTSGGDNKRRTRCR